MAEKIRIDFTESSPVAEGLQAVLFILASTFCSIRQLTAKAALANKVIPNEPPQQNAPWHHARRG